MIADLRPSAALSPCRCVGCVGCGVAILAPLGIKGAAFSALDADHMEEIFRGLTAIVAKYLDHLVAVLLWHRRVRNFLPHNVPFTGHVNHSHGADRTAEGI